ncbi:hypothetical protein B0H14DRAFT_2625900 [Mycena olivaceomarginata]|nr:hypothetical protein B0H14DRAFT_2625900 [Mycena olivaceomarginata]
MACFSALLFVLVAATASATAAAVQYTIPACSSLYTHYNGWTSLDSDLARHFATPTLCAIAELGDFAQSPLNTSSLRYRTSVAIPPTEAVAKVQLFNFASTAKYTSKLCNKLGVYPPEDSLGGSSQDKDVLLPTPGGNFGAF